jgi:hypothetical protein
MRENFYYTERGADWVRRALGEAVLNDRQERALRFLEEAVELAQACGLPEAQASRLLARVYAKEPGGVKEEMAGSYFTLLMLARAHDVSIDWELLKEFRRVDTPEMIARIRQKHAGKAADGVGMGLGGHALRAEGAATRQEMNAAIVNGKCFYCGYSESHDPLCTRPELDR